MDFIPGIDEIPVERFIVIFTVFLMLFVVMKNTKTNVAAQFLIYGIALVVSLVLLFGVDWC